ncbi:hypothetical protein CTZ27_14320 [Streptomyces griseocarneus]|nr:hypothetical protein CTZ27_14320 [Streptomyces griseocarneus]
MLKRLGFYVMTGFLLLFGSSAVAHAHDNPHAPGSLSLPKASEVLPGAVTAVHNLTTSHGAG